MAKKVGILVHGKHHLLVSETKAKALVDGGQATYIQPDSPEKATKPEEMTKKKKPSKKKPSRKKPKKS